MTQNSTGHHGLGRAYIPDERDRAYPARSIIREEPVRRWRYHWNQGWHGDQGATSQCVAYTFLHMLEDGPHTRAPRAPGEGPIVSPPVLYREAQERDEWAGENYDGTSARGAAKALQERGLISEYRWGWTVDTVVDWILQRGPVALGCWWWSSMWNTDSNGFLRVSGSREGGHETLINGANRDRGVVRVKNSWGKSFGINGHFWLTFDDLARLLEDQGDACMVIEVSE